MEYRKRDMSLFSKYRSQLLGVSIIFIIIFHYFEDCLNSECTGITRLFAKGYFTFIGSIGVEFFLFLSGMGLFYSLRKNNSLIPFYKKRMIRVVFPYAIYGFLFWLLKDIIILKTNFITFISDYTLISFWTDGNKNIWYISFILLMYIVTPFFYDLFYKKSGNSIIKLIAVIAAVIIICTLMNAFSNAVYSNFEIAVTRIPIFLIGLFCGKYVSDSKDFPKLLYIGLLCKICMIILAKTHFIPERSISEISRFVTSFYSIPLLFLIAVIYSCIKSKSLDAFLSKCGEYSLELYLTHVTVRTIFGYIGLPTSNLINYILVLVISVLLSIALHWTTEKIVGSKKIITKESV